MSNAALLLATAEKAKRRDEFKAFLTDWGQQAQADINAEVAARASRDEPPLAEAQTHPRSRMTAEMVQPLAAGPGEEAPPDRAGLQASWQSLSRKAACPALRSTRCPSRSPTCSAADVAKIVRRCLDLAHELEPVLAAKAAEENDASDGGGCRMRETSPGLERLRELGFSQLAGEDGRPAGGNVRRG